MLLDNASFSAFFPIPLFVWLKISGIGAISKHCGIDIIAEIMSRIRARRFLILEKLSCVVCEQKVLIEKMLRGPRSKQRPLRFFFKKVLSQMSQLVRSALFSLSYVNGWTPRILTLLNCFEPGLRHLFFFLEKTWLSPFKIVKGKVSSASEAESLL